MSNDITYLVIPTKQKAHNGSADSADTARTSNGFPVKVYGVSTVVDGVGCPPYYDVRIGEEGLEHIVLDPGTNAYNKVLKLVGKYPRHEDVHLKTAQRLLLNNDLPKCVVDEHSAEELLILNEQYTELPENGILEFRSIIERCATRTRRPRSGEVLIPKLICVSIIY